MEDTIKLWELIKWASEGAYLDGDYFKQAGKENCVILIKNNKLRTFNFLELNSEWIYVGNE